MRNAAKGFTNARCPAFPCHPGVDEREFNCLFCYCPLYHLEDCGGNHSQKGIGGENIKDCSLCSKPHMGEEGYDFVLNRLEQDLRSK